MLHWDLLPSAACVGVLLGILYGVMVFALWPLAQRLPTWLDWVKFVLGMGPLVAAFGLWCLVVPPPATAVDAFAAFLVMLAGAGGLDIAAYLAQRWLTGGPPADGGLSLVRQAFQAPKEQ